MSSVKKEEVPTPFDKEAKDGAPAAVEKSRSRTRRQPTKKGDAAAASAPEPKPSKVNQRRHNVIMVRKSVTFKTLVIQAKNLLKNQFDTIELHAVDDTSYLTISLVAQCLMKYKYVVMTRLKTKTHQTVEAKEGGSGKEASKTNFAKHLDEDADPRIILQPKLVIHLQKTPEFDSIYDDFEAVYKKVAEEHEEEIAMGDKEAGDDDGEA